MTNMDHNEAVRLQAAEKYLLGELPKEQHAAFEEHYFECSACAEELKTTVAFLESSRQVVREGAPQAIDEKRLVPTVSRAGGWFGWLRPAFAVPAFAALLLFIGYQNGVTIPSLKQASSHVAVAEVAQHFTLPALSRGRGASDSKTILVNPRKYFNLEVDMPSDTPTDYICQIRDAAGNVRHTVQVSAEESKNTVEIKIPAGSLQPGKYELFAFKANAASTVVVDETPRQSFTIEFVQ
jgi:hypothetical protein